MSLAHIDTTEGRTDDQDRAVIGTVTDAFVDGLDAPQVTVRHMIQDVPETCRADFRAIREGSGSLKF